MRQPDSSPATEQEQAEFFDQLCEGFREAAARTGEIVRDFRVAGTSVRLRFAGQALMSSIVPGLANAVSELEAGPRCEVCLWDSESTGAPLAPQPRPAKDFTERGNIWGFDSPRCRSAYQWGESSVNVMDRATGRAVYWVPSPKHVPAWVLAAPLRSILHWWMELNGRQLVHAAAVGHRGHGVLIPGRGGSGKSSTSLACLLDGFDFLGDDYVALALDPQPRIYRLYSTAKLDPRTLTQYPELQKRCHTVYQPGFDKVVLFLEDHYREQLRESLPLELVLKPRFSGSPETTLGPVKPLEIERALASETLVHLPHAGMRTLEFLSRVSHQVPRAAIHLGTDRARIPAAIPAALEGEASVDASGRPPSDPKPFVSVIAHLWEEDREELRTLAEAIEAQGYPRTEFLVILDGRACSMAGEKATLPDNVRFLSFNDPVVSAEAWNRGIRESFADLLLFLEPGDRLQPGALESLVNACERVPEASWIQGRVLCEGLESPSPSSLRGALIRKSAFRECGLFHTEPFFQSREHIKWIQQANVKGLSGSAIDSLTLRVARPAAMKPGPPILKPDLGFLKGELARRRKKKPE
ncbi:MAG TPA: hypothetical protein VMH05_25420 [Bryobacteraceae bacterium]|nr:hypothetical protein [Bryobacteraceae bacterium]